ncbi:hypothetical protein R5H30_14835 [Sulfitobacter sp. D35]|uniref:hypothetical protein n=1 Tax=Sulfitobacter sp. D35 TaxID=3083252 RepID=UPI00296FD87E|nr:hypothetical protein [Sulfitobacter sp. D35]MDW4499266.1 hypothetical protein [Sulfitobacter sp. D35]
MSASSFLGIAVMAAMALGAKQLYGQTVSEVHFETGASSAEIAGEITGNDYVDYTLGARAGQTMTATITPSGSLAVYFNILPPGSQGEAIFIGSTEGESASIELPEDGDYTLRVYQMGNAKDAGETHGYTLAVGIE